MGVLVILTASEVSSSRLVVLVAPAFAPFVSELLTVEALGNVGMLLQSYHELTDTRFVVVIDGCLVHS